MCPKKAATIYCAALRVWGCSSVAEKNYTYDRHGMIGMAGHQFSSRRCDGRTVEVQGCFVCRPRYVVSFDFAPCFIRDSPHRFPYVCARNRGVSTHRSSGAHRSRPGGLRRPHNPPPCPTLPPSGERHRQPAREDYRAGAHPLEPPVRVHLHPEECPARADCV